MIPWLEDGRLLDATALLCRDCLAIGAAPWIAPSTSLSSSSKSIALVLCKCSVGVIQKCSRRWWLPFGLLLGGALSIARAMRMGSWRRWQKPDDCNDRQQ